jgi:uncharacterized membrane protein (GlpM family)
MMAANARTNIIIVFAVVDVLITLVFVIAWLGGNMRLVDALKAAAVLWMVNAIVFAGRMRRLAADASKAPNAPIEPE